MLPHNFQLVQLGSPAMVYMIGGGEFNMNARSLRETRKLVKKDDKFGFGACADMRHPRHGHSACSVNDKFIVVTGSRVDKAGDMCEIYNQVMNKWTDLPKMKSPRHYHSSCAFNSGQIFVFCGINNPTKKYINTIEMLDINMFQQGINTNWQPFEIDYSPDFAENLTARQGLGTCQIDDKSILIVGGYTGAYSKDGYILNVATKKLRKTPNLPADCFPFAVPTIADTTSKIAYTVDWTRYKLFRYKADSWEIVTNFKG